MKLLKKNRYDRLCLKLGRLWIRADRWPWQVRNHRAVLSGPGEKVGEKYGWLPTQGTGRFGGGWNWNLGIQVGGTTVLLELLFGTVMITWSKSYGNKEVMVRP